MPSTNDVARRCEFPYVRGTGHLGLTFTSDRIYSAPTSLSPHAADATATGLDRLWKKARTAADDAESLRTLAKILSSKDGRAFIFGNPEPQENIVVH